MEVDAEDVPHSRASRAYVLASALIHIDSEVAPARFEFPVSGDVTALTLNDDGSVTATDAAGEIIAVADVPWAVDATGHEVPTHYEVEGTTLIQVVEHRGGNFAYGITADPNWWKIGKSVAAISWVVGSAAFAVGRITKVKGAIKELGGIKETAKLLVEATSKSEKMRALGGAGAAAA